jgi:hypothetical protein
MGALSMKTQPQKDDLFRLQAIMHYHGLEHFKELLKEAAQNAADETESISIDISTRWTEFSELIGQEEAPEEIEKDAEPYTPTKVSFHKLEHDILRVLYTAKANEQATDDALEETWESFRNAIRTLDKSLDVYTGRNE